MSKPKFMPVWLYSRAYTLWSKFIHSRGYHYAPRRFPPEPYDVRMGIDGNPIREWFHWCQWCGLRGKTIDHSKKEATNEQ